MKKLFERLGGFAGLGTTFEQWVGKTLNAAKGFRVKNGVAYQQGMGVEGSAVIDFLLT